MTEKDQAAIEPGGKWFFEYRKGYFRALVDILNLFEFIDVIYSKRDAIAILEAAAHKPDTLMKYGSQCVLKCTDWDKKTRKPIKYELMEYGWRPSKERKESSENKENRETEGNEESEGNI